jgi:hypothetical protein
MFFKIKSSYLGRILFLIPTLALLGICIYFVLTTSPLVRYWADDFCSAIPLRNGGYWGAQVGWWMTWTGRYSYIAFLDIFELLGPWAANTLPVLILIGTTLALIPAFTFEVVLAPLFVILALINAPNLIQSFYWQVGSLNYAFEFIFLNLFLSLLVWPKKKFAYPVTFILPLIAGGFSESYAMAQTVIISFILLIVFISGVPDKKLRIKLSVIGLIGSIVSIGIMSLSPGNAARASLVDHPESFAFVIKSTFYGTKWYLQRMFMIPTFVVSLILSAMAVFITVERKWKIFMKMFFGIKRMLLIMFLSILSAVFSTSAVIFSGYYAMAYTPPERAMFIAIYMIFISFIIFCFAGSVLCLKIISHKLKKYLIWVVLVFCFASSMFLIKSTISDWGNVRQELTTYARDWDSEKLVFIKAFESNDKKALIKNIKPVGELDGFTENRGWVLGCVKEYYKLKEIRLK